MSGTVLHPPASARRAAQAGWAKPVLRAGWLDWLAATLRAIETRRELARLDDRMLRDVGLTPHAAMEEAARAPWDLAPRPRHASWIHR